MTNFIKKIVFEIVAIVVGYIAITVLQIVGRLTMKFGRVVFNR